MSKTIGLYWFTNDLRVHDNTLLLQAANQVDSLICIYCYPQFTPFLSHYAQESFDGQAKQQFLHESLECLDASLSALNQTLFISKQPAISFINSLLALGVTDFYTNATAGFDEQMVVKRVRVENPKLRVHQTENASLFTQDQLPFALNDLPTTFSKFRKKIESTPLREPSQRIVTLPPMPNEARQLDSNYIVTGSRLAEWIPSSLSSRYVTVFNGGESEGLAHCQRYFSSALPSEYKRTRNGLEGMDYSTKFSPWLAFGCVSPRSICAMLKMYEQSNGANDSTYWIYFELLWREYFYWYARRYERKLFHFGGIQNKPPLTSFYANRFQQWKQGQTPFPIVNACMRQLKSTGYMSNRGRQLVASCLVHEFALDWRYGAAYFESQLVDYDVASNWGNWQYLAGVGADPRGSRQFNLDKQTQMYDPSFTFIDTWRGRETLAPLDSVDMVDWPIENNNEHGEH